MAREFAKPFYNSKQWEKCRQGYISQRQSIDGGICERCKDSLGYIVHHKVHITPDNINDPYITLGHDNLSYMCHDCHNREHGGDNSPLRDDVIFNSNGELIRSD